MLIVSPLRVPISKTKLFTLNLNIYRNSHFHVLYKAKIEYKKVISKQLVKLPKLGVVTISYTYFPKTKRKVDLGNVLSIHQKFFEDAIVELGVLEDDDYKHIPKTIYLFGGIDKTNPRVEIRIKNYANTVK